VYIIVAVLLVLEGCVAQHRMRELRGGACLTDESSLRRALSGMDGQSAGKTLIADPTICHRAAAAYPGRPEADRLFDVVVAQLPNGDYYVFAPGTSRAPESSGVTPRSSMRIFASKRTCVARALRGH
jgi:hypothetical protein